MPSSRTPSSCARCTSRARRPSSARSCPTSPTSASVSSSCSCSRPITGAEIGWQVVYVPLLFVAILIPAVAVAIPLAGLAVYYRDFKYALPTGVQLWFFASPVVYPVTVVSPEWRWLYTLLNPVVGQLEGFRRVLAEGTDPDVGAARHQRRLEPRAAVCRPPDLQAARRRVRGRDLTCGRCASKT